MNLKEALKRLYPNTYQETYTSILSLIEDEKINKDSTWLNEHDVMLITYGDSILKKNEKPLKTLHHFLKSYTKGFIPNVHLLPMYPYTSDDGFSVIDYEKINPDLGSWDDIKSLSLDYALMFDGVINHISKESDWFKGYLNQDPNYQDYFIPCDPDQDYSKVTRPRALPLYYPYHSQNGIQYIWATFSEDQVDLNYKNPKVLLHILKIMIFYAKQGAKFIRLDAIGFLWKELGTSCIHLPETHLLIKIIRYVIDQTVPGTLLISETNVPHLENISYFGDQDDEASLVYQFPLPPLVLYTYMMKNVSILSRWIKSLDLTPLHPRHTYFNFLASHDGIGVRPVEGILSEDQKMMMINHVIQAGGKISYKNNPDGKTSPYEMNISYVDAITYGEEESLHVDKFISSQAILIFLKGMPGIYIHSLLGTRNDLEGLNASGINRRINRKKLSYDDLSKSLSEIDSFESKVLHAYLKLISYRKSHRAFSPDSKQEVLDLDPRILALKRYHMDDDEAIYVYINVSGDLIQMNLDIEGINLKTLLTVHKSMTIEPYAYELVKVKR